MERLNAEPQPEAKPEAQAAAAKGLERPVTALMAFLQEQHARKSKGTALALRERKDRAREGKARGVGIPWICFVVGTGSPDAGKNSNSTLLPTNSSAVSLHYTDSSDGLGHSRYLSLCLWPNGHSMLN